MHTYIISHILCTVLVFLDVNPVPYPLATLPGARALASNAYLYSRISRVRSPVVMPDVTVVPGVSGLETRAVLHSMGMYTDIDIGDVNAGQRGMAYVSEASSTIIRL